jgi:hypothetical protein
VPLRSLVFEDWRVYLRALGSVKTVLANTQYATNNAPIVIMRSRKPFVKAAAGFIGRLMISLRESTKH